LGVIPYYTLIMTIIKIKEASGNKTNMTTCKGTLIIPMKSLGHILCDELYHDNPDYTPDFYSKLDSEARSELDRIANGIGTEAIQRSNAEGRTL